MVLTDILRECEKRGLTLLTDGKRVGVKGDVDEAFFPMLKAHKPELLRYLINRKKLRELIPGPMERQDFRRQVIEEAGIAWHACPVPLREDVVSKFILSENIEAVLAFISPLGSWRTN